MRVTTRKKNGAKTFWKYLGILFVAAGLAAPVPNAWGDSSKKADLSRLLVVGDSLAAGFQNGSLLARQQVNGFASLLADQAQVALSLPLIAEPGIPNVLTLVDLGPPPVLGREPGVSTGRINPTVQATNLAVPGATVQDALTTRPDLPFDDLTDLVLGLPGVFSGISRSQVEWAEGLAPTTILIWIGNNDVLAAAIQADASLLTPVADFEAAYAEVMDRLAATGATLVVANIPDISSIPFLTSAEEVAAVIGLPLDFLGPILGIGPGDLVTPDAFELIGEILRGSAGPLPDNVVLDADEVAEIRTATEAFNAFIARQAAAKGAALVDFNALTDSIDADGFVVGGQRLTLSFLGGVFSLDGIHPTNTGHGLIANEFIKALNTRFAAGIPPVSIRRIQKSDPLVLPGIGHPPSAFGSMGAAAVAAVRAVLAR